MALTAQSTVNEWLEDPVGGALIRDLMSQRGVVSQEIVDELVAKVSG